MSKINVKSSDKVRCTNSSVHHETRKEKKVSAEEPKEKETEEETKE